MRLADRLNAVRHRRFVGRDPERAQFHAAIAAPELPYQVLFVHGPGGVGKSSLLAEFAFQCGRSGVAVASLDCRNVDASPDAFVTALRVALGLEGTESPFQAIGARPGRQVVCVDTYEMLRPLDNWLRDVFLPQAPDNALFVFAGREPPALAWRTDPGWQVMLRQVSLRNLSPDEGRTYLAQRDVPAEQYAALLDFTHGHPLALSLVADVFEQRGELRFRPESAPDVVQTLVQQFVQKVPGPAHRTALEVSALVRQTSESLLTAVLGTASSDLFEWLRELSFMDQGPYGLFPHDLAREALLAELRWRNPDWYAELHRRARAFYSARIQQGSVEEQQTRLIDYIFLHRENAVVRPFFEALRGSSHAGPTPSALLVSALHEADVPLLEGMVARHEGDVAARVLQHWVRRQPSGFQVFRDEVGRPLGFIAMVALQQTTPEDAAVDPAVAAGMRYLETYAPLRAGEGATLFRFWMARDTYQAGSPLQSMVFVNMVRHYLTTPGLAFTLLPCAEPDLWAPMFAYADQARLSDADFEVDGRRFGVFGHDWRVLPPAAWLDLLGEREIAMSTPTSEAPPPPSDPLVVLSEPAFAAAVHEALREMVRPEQLRRNPILRSRLVAEQVGLGALPADRVAGLQALVRNAAEALQRSPREVRLYDVVDRTYFRPAATQERAAELLDLPFSTYRRHLKAAVTRITEILWQRELDGV